MRILLVSILGSLLVAGAAQDPKPLSVTTPTTLWDGRTLDGWYTWTKEHRYDDPLHVFSVKDGLLRISGEEWGGIATRATYRDYRLVVEWKWGTLTWGERKTAARDSGILVHGVGADGAASGVWLQSFEAQVIEGGTGDLILVAGEQHPSFTATIKQDGDQFYWQEGGVTRQMTEGRLNWFGRDPAWKDVLGFRGRADLERPAGEWNRQEIVASGDTITSMVNGVTVAKASACSQQAGKIQLQSEGAEIFVRRVELLPL